jgi:hypothetical protein
MRNRFLTIVLSAQGSAFTADCGPLGATIVGKDIEEVLTSTLTAWQRLSPTIKRETEANLQTYATVAGQTSHA